MSFFYRKNSRVGVEIQPHEIRLIQLKKIGRTFQIEQAVKETMPSGVMSEGKILQGQRITSLVAEWTRLLNWEGLATVIVLPASAVHRQHITLSLNLPEQAYTKEIEAHVRRDLFGLQDALAIDYTLLSATIQERDVLVSVTRQDDLTKYITCIEEAGLKVKIADMDLYALMRLFIFSAGLILKTAEIYVLICVMEDTIRFILFDQHEILYHQDESVKASDFLMSWRAFIKMSFSLLSFTHIHTLLFYGPSYYYDKIKEEEKIYLHPIQICLNPYDRLKLGRYLDTDFFSTNASHFFVACGAAMREMPAW